MYGGHAHVHIASHRPMVAENQMVGDGVYSCDRMNKCFIPNASMDLMMILYVDDVHELFDCVASEREEGK